MAKRIIQTFVGSCSECPHWKYYSGGVYECTLTDERMGRARSEVEVGRMCPLPFAGGAPTKEPIDAQ